tara:strand:- start:746 stop:1474 length:729 start_codon:yes stop_codon:yes gene_type:complete
MDFAEFRQLVDDMGLTQDACEEMDRWGHESAPRLKKALLELYTTIAQSEDLSAYFADIEQLGHVRQKQYDHWRLLLAGFFDETYLESAKRIGRVHCSIGLEPHAFLTGYAAVLSKLLRDASHSAGRQDTVIDALTRAALLDIGVALTSYSEAEESKARHSRLKFSNSFRLSMAQTMAELDQSMDSLSHAAAVLGDPEAHTDSQGMSPAQLARSVTEATATVRSQLDAVRAKMDEFMKAACEA